MRVRSRCDQANNSLAGGDIVALFHRVGYRLDGKTLLLNPTQFRIVAGNTYGRLSRCQPINQLSMISTQGQLHIAIQLAHEFRTQKLIHIEVPKNIAGNAGNGWVVPGNFPLPLRVYEIPPRPDFFDLCLLCVGGDVKASMSLKDERVTSFRIDKTMLFLEPL